MKLQKIKLSLVSKILFICIIAVFSALLIKYYNDVKLNLKQMSQDLHLIIFLNDKVESQDVVVPGLESLNYFNVLEYVDKEMSYQRALELNPKLSADITVENKYYPAYIIANDLQIKDNDQFNNIKEQISQLEYVSEIGYDQKAFDIFVKNLEMISMYEKVFINLALIVFVLFIIKVTLYVIKGKISIVLIEIFYGALASIIGYTAIGIVASISYQQFFILDWHMLVLLIPLGCVISFMTKESNV
ncbi:MAG: hypothetical protein PHR82_03525 [Endomicrobiaceae bacterium]|nr:hypothetical protein [Endomicrobiaceae bacterium]